ncbi:hypothetical protein EJB05_21313, partial [Eragrostis curvula]
MGGEARGKKDARSSFMSLFAHADAADVTLMVLGLLGAVGDGMSTPLKLLITSRIANDLGSGPDQLRHFSSRINENVRDIFILACASWIMAFLGELS